MRNRMLDKDEKISAAKEELDELVVEKIEDMIGELLNCDAGLYLEYKKDEMIEFVDRVWTHQFVDREGGE